MTGARGPRSKDGAARRNKPRAKTHLEGEVAEAPELVGDYSEATLAWWAGWLSSPQRVNFAATDWQRLLMLAPLVEAYFKNPSPQLMAEIRQNEAKLGATAQDRDRLGWTIDAPPDAGEDADAGGSRARRPDPRKGTP